MQKKTSAPTSHVLNPFIAKHQNDVMGILHSFDRLRFQGSLRYLYCAKIFEEYLSKAKVLFKDFKQFATGLTAEVCQSAEQLASSMKRPFTYLSSSAISKEEEAQKIVARDGIREGLVAVFRCVEPCRTYKMRGNYQTKLLEPRLEWGKCILRTIWTIAVQRKTEGNSELCERPNIRNNRPQFFRNVRETESKLLKSVPSYL